ncbi:MAG: addiction module protein [Flavobacteriales bacterium CG18_big_fil_WC_8_21_14_2_50_32_9]|nr:MAG: addiction module protein [Flavobacteriales bacterium CG18_big_fil_WC_8_21_14_2_50_32_9]PIZ06475.1 MAG: addiction module protein [Flavobacteriales bacterium CG_4_10_14_0_8_um_filter_32_5]
MNTQDIQTEKLDLITWITQLQDISLIEKLKKLRVKNDTADFTVPEWQKNIVRDRIKNTKPEDYLAWEDVEKQFKFDE